MAIQNKVVIERSSYSGSIFQLPQNLISSRSYLRHPGISLFTLLDNLVARNLLGIFKVHFGGNTLLYSPYKKSEPSVTSPINSVMKQSYDCGKRSNKLKFLNCPPLLIKKKNLSCKQGADLLQVLKRAEKFNKKCYLCNRIRTAPYNTTLTHKTKILMTSQNSARFRKISVLISFPENFHLFTLCYCYVYVEISEQKF